MSTSPQSTILVWLIPSAAFRLLLAVLFALLAPTTARAEFAAPALMLAEVYQPGVDVTEYWVSEKLDGVRAYWDGHQLISRGGTQLHAPDWFTAGFPAVALDGELWMGRGTFEAISGAVRRQVPDEAQWRQVRYLVFDMPDGGPTFGQRLERLRDLLGTPTSPCIALVEQVRVADHAALMARLEAVVADGGEGLMLHRDAAPYRAERSTDLLKLKPYLDAEARVTAYLPGKGKYAGMLGALEVETAEGVRFAIGSGFSDAQRRAPPPIGSLVTYKYHGLTARGVPRFASFVRVREEP